MEEMDWHLSAERPCGRVTAGGHLGPGYSDDPGCLAGVRVEQVDWLGEPGFLR